MSDTLLKRDVLLAEESPNVRLVEVRELEKAEFESDALREDELPKLRLSKFDMAREDEIADPLAREEFIAIELFALPAPVMLREELEALPNEPRDSPDDLADIEELELPLPKFRVTAEFPERAEFGELPNECHCPSAIAGRALDRAATLFIPPRAPKFEPIPGRPWPPYPGLLEERGA